MFLIGKKHQKSYEWCSFDTGGQARGGVHDVLMGDDWQVVLTTAGEVWEKGERGPMTHREGGGHQWRQVQVMINDKQTEDAADPIVQLSGYAHLSPPGPPDGRKDMSFVVCRTRKGKVFTWGNNSLGQCGCGTGSKGKKEGTQINSPQQIDFDRTATSHVTQVLVVIDKDSQGVPRPRCYALIHEGRVFAWGNNQNGILGVGPEALRASVISSTRGSLDQKGQGGGGGTGGKGGKKIQLEYVNQPQHVNLSESHRDSNGLVRRLELRGGEVIAFTDGDPGGSGTAERGDRNLMQAVRPGPCKCGSLFVASEVLREYLVEKEREAREKWLNNIKPVMCKCGAPVYTKEEILRSAQGVKNLRVLVTKLQLLWSQVKKDIGHGGPYEAGGRGGKGSLVRESVEPLALDPRQEQQQQPLLRRDEAADLKHFQYAAYNLEDQEDQLRVLATTLEKVRPMEGADLCTKELKCALIEALTARLEVIKLQKALTGSADQRAHAPLHEGLREIVSAWASVRSFSVQRIAKDFAILHETDSFDEAEDLLAVLVKVCLSVRVLFFFLGFAGSSTVTFVFLTFLF
uniref:Uncharacterized protein n=1 Tax=Chromera velia CCMP2878 TaxID=1169474 RepID=A0A0G4HHK1_9ALVE|eukprot:Cvel_6821.t1-p1 / transcript=Cvel_6821.t1 / gene=Cvel_6821 / organism=Chromera_velia_CCMP2878 / gene_product=hypothetical protein / transcript_product=hypothetical protein / location=Cvel_scaffold344:320-8740(-) / protein_length=572 / sequence_SO=supercontig / SO=protein_coding / is_pseudo=false